MESSIIAQRSVPSAIWQKPGRADGSTRPGARQVARNAEGIGQRAVINRRRIQAPNGGQQQDLFCIGTTSFELGELTSGVAFAVIVASQAEFAFRPGLV